MVLNIPDDQIENMSTKLKLRLTQDRKFVSIEPTDGIKNAENFTAGEREGKLRDIINGVIRFISGLNEAIQQTTDDSDSEGYVSKYKNVYEEEIKLGSGGYGSAYRCINKVDGLVSAVKFVTFAGCGENQLRELRAMSIAQHPNVVRCYDAWFEDEAPHTLTSCSETSLTTSSSKSGTPKKALCIAMECCDRTLGKELEKNLSKSKKDMKLIDKETVKMIREIASGLCHIHKQGVIHLDLSKDNIFIDSEGVAKIADFGLAVFLRDGEADAERLKPITKYISTTPKEAIINIT
ncbi:Mitosis inhibitor protein kinase wee1 [Orobanche minor]